MSDYERFYSTPYYRAILFLVGYLGSLLWLATDRRPAAPFWAVIIYAIMALLLLALLFWLNWLRPRLKNRGYGARGEIDEWPWGDANRARSARWLALGLTVLGFGTGIAAFVYKEWLKLLGRRFFLDINTTERVLLTFLFLLGVVMGAYVVRNWSKKQEEFNASVTTALGAAFLTAILGRVQGEGDNFTTNIAHYGLGFVISFTVNLLAFSLLSARYSSTQSLTARALLDLLYGSDKADAIDRYFLKNFEDNPESAKQLLVQSLVQYREQVLAEYARKLDKEWVPGAMNSPPDDLHAYQLVSIESDTDDVASPPSPDNAASPPSPDNAVPNDDRLYKVKLRRINGISKEMFRMGIAVKRVDTLTYIITPGEYRRAFPFYGSVAGLALTMRKTIVMYRDEHTKFRNDSFRDGITPHQVFQSRGLDVLDYLSYVVLPVVSSYSNQGEVGLGIVNVDTKLFLASKTEVRDDQPDSGGAAEIIINAMLTPNQLQCWSKRLYHQQDDKAIKYLEDMIDVAVPIIQLYVKCLQGVS
jgi:hypothetical protein